MEESPKRRQVIERKGTAIYVGHLPEGFEEAELRSFFGQYGKVTGVKLARSRKTANSKGFCFVEFQSLEVASIAAQSINGYLINGKTLVSHVLDDNVFKYPLNRKRYIPMDYRKIFRESRKKEMSDEQKKNLVQKLLDKEEERRTKLKEKGIEYDFPGFKACIQK